MWVVKHLANDWLAGTWFFLWINIIMTFGSGILLIMALAVNSAQQIFIWLSGFTASFMFLVGSYYFVSGKITVFLIHWIYSLVLFALSLSLSLSLCV